MVAVFVRDWWGVFDNSVVECATNEILGVVVRSHVAALATRLAVIKETDPAAICKFQCQRFVIQRYVRNRFADASLKRLDGFLISAKPFDHYT